MSKQFRSPERKTPFAVSLGCGIKFEYDGMLMEIPLPDLPREVHWDISTFRGTCPGAVHYYATMRVHDECATVLKVLEKEDARHEVGDRFSSTGFPIVSPYMNGWSIEVGFIAKQDIKSWSMFDGKDVVSCKKGRVSRLFSTFEEVKKITLSEFSRLFPGEDWKLDDLNGRLEDMNEKKYFGD